MKEHGVGASTFSDWWANKFEVIDAISYNGALMHNQVFTVADFSADLLLKNNIGVLLRHLHDMPMSEDQDADLPYKMAGILTDKGIIFGLDKSGD